MDGERCRFFRAVKTFNTPALLCTPPTTLPPLLFRSDPSQCDSNSKDFWFNMQALTSYLRKASDQNPSASYYNVDILKYQVSRAKRLIHINVCTSGVMSGSAYIFGLQTGRKGGDERRVGRGRGEGAPGKYFSK